MNFAKSLSHPSEILSLINFQFLGGKQRLFPANDQSEDTPTMKRCYYYLDRTSRSFAAVIKALHPELRPAVCLFYLVLRGLDTVEDDMSLDPAKKRELLKSFHEKLYEPGWKFKGSGPNEKDRDLLVEFNVVIDEFLHLKREYAEVIADICKKMGNGMVKFMRKEVVTVDDYNQYCHYVAGLVGIGLSRLFAASNLENNKVGEDHDCANSMGLFLQKTNIIRDYHEDLVEGRTWWPKEIWSLYSSELKDFAEPKHQSAALDCLNHLVANALEHVHDVFVYMGRLKEQTVFNFCAIPQVMAIATLALCYNNANVFARNVKIRKGQAVQLMMQAQSMGELYLIFERFALEIKEKAPKSDNRVRSVVDAILAKVEAARAEGKVPERTEPSANTGSVAVPLVLVGGAAAAAYYFGVHRRSNA
eukprot:TRINITY_DN7100_c0_g2_i1.p1 TRINITY_DN7100_c0_g2~~TRINITY_DN7100_c0_g2_i1.p1  ORF type:complete len:418 (+),score=124.82 TRINITY_DN7100_c0_g2_i1:1062-2315(+)